jgi:CheY-like chemotaxis protein
MPRKTCPRKRGILAVLRSVLLLLTSPPSGSTIRSNHLSKEGALVSEGVIMYHAPPLRGRPILPGKNVLLIDRCQATCEVRAAVLRSHGVEVHAAADLSGARFLWQPNVYDLIMLDVRRYSPGEALEFYEQIREASPHQRFAFLIGPPTYLSLAWPQEAIAEDASSGQWGETVRRFLAAA